MFTHYFETVIETRGWNYIQFEFVEGYNENHKYLNTVKTI